MQRACRTLHYSLAVIPRNFAFPLPPSLTLSTSLSLSNESLSRYPIYISDQVCLCVCLTDSLALIEHVNVKALLSCCGLCVSLFVLCRYTQVKYGKERVQVHSSRTWKHTRSLSALEGLVIRSNWDPVRNNSCQWVQVTRLWGRAALVNMSGEKTASLERRWSSRIHHYRDTASDLDIIIRFPCHG